MCAKLLYRCQNRPRLAPGYCRPFSVGILVLLPPSDLCSAFSSTRTLLPMWWGVLSSTSLMWILLSTLFNPSLIHVLLINSAKLFTFYTTSWTAYSKGHNSENFWLQILLHLITIQITTIMKYVQQVWIKMILNRNMISSVYLIQTTKIVCIRGKWLDEQGTHNNITHTATKY